MAGRMWPVSWNACIRNWVTRHEHDSAQIDRLGFGLVGGTHRMSGLARPQASSR